MPKRLGQSITLVDESLVFHPTQGYQLRRTWEGTHGGMLQQQAQAELEGAQAEINNKPGSAGLWICSAFYSDRIDGSDELAFETWDFEMEQAQFSIWSHPKVDERMAAQGSKRADWRKRIEDAVSKGTALPTDLASDNVALGVYYDLIRGTEAYSVKWPVLMRQRSFTPSYIKRPKMDAVEAIYSTRSLISNFEVPPHVAALLPDNPKTAAPTNTTWGWKPRRYSARLIRGSNKVEEVNDWVFAAWSNLLYTLA